MAKIKNVTNTQVVFGRFRVLPSEYVPAVPFTATEQKSIDTLLDVGVLVSEAAPVQAQAATPPASPPKDEVKKPAAKSDEKPHKDTPEAEA